MSTTVAYIALIFGPFIALCQSYSSKQHALAQYRDPQCRNFLWSGHPRVCSFIHTWGEEEVLFEDLIADIGRKKKGWSKILLAVAEAIHHKYKYIWIDTCCIDKNSSSELSEAIDSMFRWYRRSKVCLVYLEDFEQEMIQERKPKIVVIESDGEAVTPPMSPLPKVGSFCNSRWFRRGWTLQELIAPSNLWFYDRSWQKIGYKVGLRKALSLKTGVDVDVLVDYRAVYTKSVSRRMSWVSDRETTRPEDIAYCLLGIFDVSLPLLYGEGHKAFIRLREAIMISNYDRSLFAWGQDQRDIPQFLDAVSDLLRKIKELRTFDVVHFIS